MTLKTVGQAPIPSFWWDMHVLEKCLTQVNKIMRVPTLCCKLYLSYQLHLDALMLQLLPWDVGYLYLLICNDCVVARPIIL